MVQALSKRAEIAIGAGLARVAVVADSHGKPHPEAYRLLKREQPAAILHAGDVGRLEVLDELERIAPTLAVRGNIDGREAKLPDELLVDVTRQGAVEVRILLTHFGVNGPRLRSDVRARAREQLAVVVACGHSHLPLLVNDGQIAVFNPGSLGPRRFRLPITFGVLDISGDSFALRHVDCETGQRWRPPRR